MRLKMKIYTKICIVLTGCIFLSGCIGGNSRRKNFGIPFTDSKHEEAPQVIPGKIQCEYYDRGGEGIAYHDSDAVNSGSGQLNPADGTYLNEFRINESVDISYTKQNDVDDNEYNFVKPEMGQLYIGWTEPGEWFNMTVNVQEAGIYRVGIMYTANGDGEISLSVDNKDATGAIAITTTHRKEDPLDWRQWHHWNYLKDIAEIKLKKGTHVLTLHTVSNGNMNYDYLELTLKD